jgi:hypothetical protein
MPLSLRVSCAGLVEKPFAAALMPAQDVPACGCTRNSGRIRPVIDKTPQGDLDACAFEKKGPALQAGGGMPTESDARTCRAVDTAMLSMRRFEPVVWR